MALDTRLPLMAETPNILGAMAQSTQLAGAQAGLMRQAEGQNLFRQYGADAMQGQQGALNALAGFDPAMAQNMDTTRRENQRADRRLQISEAQLGIAREAAKRAAEQHAVTMSAAERQREAAAIEQGLMQVAPLIAQARDTGDVTALNQALQGFGMEPVADADAAMLLAAQYSGVAEVLKGADELRPQPQGPLSSEGKLYADLQAGRITQEQFDAASDKSPLVDMSGANFGPQTPVGEPLGTDGQMLVPDATAESGFRVVAAEGSEAQRRAREAALEAASGRAKDAEKDRGETLRLGTTLESINLNIREIEDGGLPVTGAFGDLRRTGVGRALTGDSAMDFGNRSNQVTDAAALAEIQRMRDNSKTGGAVGQLTDQERVAIGNAVTALNASTSAQEYTRAAKAYRDLALNLAYGEGNWTLNGDGTVTVSPPSSTEGVPQGVDPMDWEFMTEDQRALFK